MPIEDSISVFDFESRPTNSPLVESVWRTQSLNNGSFVSTTETHWEMVVSRHQSELTITMRGPETRAKRAPFAKDTEFFGIIFKHGAFMPHLPVSKSVVFVQDIPLAVCYDLSINLQQKEISDEKIKASSTNDH